MELYRAAYTSPCQRSVALAVRICFSVHVRVPGDWVCGVRSSRPLQRGQRDGSRKFQAAQQFVLGCARGRARSGKSFAVVGQYGRCLPRAMETPCVVCGEVCPVSPKAIYSREVTFTKRDGNPITLRQPYLDPALCIGCGICEHECPVTDEAAIRVSAVGETRSKDRRLLMDGGVTSAVTDLEKRQR